MKKYKNLLRPRPIQISSIVGWCGVVVVLGASLWLGNAINRERVKGEYQAAYREQLRQKAARQAVPAAKPMGAEELAQWRSIKLEQEFPWNSLFKAIESATTDSVELLEFAPSKASRQVLLRGEAKDNSALIAYLDALTLQPQLRNVYLVRSQLAERGKLITVDFEIRATLH